MFVAIRKKEENIAEYILYMWQVEDIVRALNCDANRIDEYVEQYYDLPEDKKQQIKDWYYGIKRELISGGKKEKGHLERVENTIQHLAELHEKLLKMPSQAIYSALYYKTLPTIVQLREKGGNTQLSEVETCLTALYGYLTLKLKKAEVSEATTEAMKKLSTFLAMLSDRYVEVEAGNLKVDNTIEQ